MNKISELPADQLVGYLGPDRMLRSIATAADLATTSAAPNELCRLIEYRTGQGTGGQELYYRASGRPGTLDNGMAFAGPGADDWWESADKTTTSPDRFGAKPGDSIFDSQPAIQAALDSVATKVFFEANRIYYLRTVVSFDHACCIGLDHRHSGKVIEGNWAKLQVGDALVTTFDPVAVWAVVSNTGWTEDITIRNLILDSAFPTQTRRFDGYKEFENNADAADAGVRRIRVEGLQCEDCDAGISIAGDMGSHKGLTMIRCQRGLAVNQRRHRDDAPVPYPYRYDISDVRVIDGGDNFAIDFSSPGTVGLTHYTVTLRGVRITGTGGQFKCQEQMTLLASDIVIDGSVLVKFGDAEYVSFTNFRLINVANADTTVQNATTAISCESATEVHLANGRIENSSQLVPVSPVINFNPLRGSIRDVWIDCNDGTTALVTYGALDEQAIVVDNVTIENCPNVDYPVKINGKIDCRNLSVKNNAYGYDFFANENSGGSTWSNLVIAKGGFVRTDGHVFSDCVFALASGIRGNPINNVRVVFYERCSGVNVAWVDTRAVLDGVLHATGDQLEDPSDVVNTSAAVKTLGRAVWVTAADESGDTVANRRLYSAGTGASDVWVDADGTTVLTPT